MVSGNAQTSPPQATTAAASASDHTESHDHSNEHVSGEHITFTEAERNAMRGYLQRCEVRLSTLHRIATAFVSGAGLLLLIPVFFRDIVDGILVFFLDNAGNLFSTVGRMEGLFLTGVLYLLLLYPLVLSLGIPLYGVVLLIKDIVHFYFTIYMPGFPNTLLNPTFSLNAVAFSMDESPKVKGEVMRFQYKTDHMNFMMAFSEGKRHEYFDNMIEATQGGILPHSRRMERLNAEGWLPEGYDPTEVQRFNAAFGIARSLDRTLVQEVALTEMALVRAVLYLRRLVLRYVKTLLMFIWTTTVAFMVLPFLQNTRYPSFLILALVYTVWSLGVIPIIRVPLRWIYRHRLGDVNTEHVDAQLTQFENQLLRFCHLGIVTSIASLVLAALSYLV